MALVKVDPMTDPAGAADEVRNRMTFLVAVIRAEMSRMRDLVTGRKAAVVTALGAGDAAAMAALYGDLKTFVDAATGGNEPGIPAA